MPRTRQRGFTLVEIMIVVGILAVLIAIAVPGFIQARKQSRNRKVQHDLITIDEASRTYVLENKIGTDDGMPTLEELVDLQYLRAMPKTVVPGEYIASTEVEGYPDFLPASGARDPEWYHPSDPDKP